MTLYGFAELNYSYDRETPLYLKNYINPLIQSNYGELQELWGIGLEYPVEITIERKRQLGASGEASFDGKTYYLFMTPVTEKIPSLLRHEMMHLFTFQWLFSNQIKSAPLWFLEGLAVWYENHSTKNIEKLNPVSLLDEIDVISRKDYPSGDAFARYYSFLADFFYYLDSKIGLEEHFNQILEDIKETGEFKAPITPGKDFKTVYANWKRQKIIFSVFSFITLQLSWALPALVVIFMGIYILIRRRNIKDINIKDLERIYGKEYWKND